MTKAKPPKPCPFCGSKPHYTAQIDMEDGFQHSYSIGCVECGFELSGEYELEVLTSWNKRSSRAA